jgi:hypothetical protein
VKQGKHIRCFCVCGILSAATAVPVHAEPVISELNTLVIPEQGLTLRYSDNHKPLFDVYLKPVDESAYIKPSTKREINPDPTYSFRTGVKYQLSQMLALNFDARRRRLDTQFNLSEADARNTTKLDFDFRPWEFRLGVKYKWK